MRRFIFLINIFFLAGYAITSNAQEEWTLQDCIDYAIEHNIQIKRQELSTQYNENQLTQAKNNRLPSFSAQLSNSLNFGRSLNYDNTYSNTNSSQYNGYLATSATIWNGSVLQNTIKQRELDLMAGLQDLQKAKDDIILNIAAFYLEILFAEEQVTISLNQIEVTKQQIVSTTQLVEAGSLARGALLEIEAQLAQEDLQLVNYQNQLQLSYLNLYQLLDLPASESFTILKPTLPTIGSSQITINSTDVFANAVNIRPEIKAAQFRVESAKKQLQVAKGSQYPSLGFSANYYNLYNDQYYFQGNKMTFKDQLKNNERYGLGLTLNIPILNNFQVKNSISNAQIQVQDYQMQLESASNQLRQDIEQAYTNALAAYKQYISTEKAVQSMEEAFRYVEEKFNLGMVNSLEYNQSKNNLTYTQSELLKAKYDYIFRSKILDFYNGVKIEL